MTALDFSAMKNSYKVGPIGGRDFNGQEFLSLGFFDPTLSNGVCHRLIVEMTKVSNR